MSRPLAAICALAAAGIGLAAFAPPRGACTDTYRVARGDTLSVIARRCRSSVDGDRPGERDRQSEPDPGRPAAGHSRGARRNGSARFAVHAPLGLGPVAGGAGGARCSDRLSVRARRHALFAGALVAGQRSRLARRQSRRRSRADRDRRRDRAARRRRRAAIRPSPRARPGASAAVLRPAARPVRARWEALAPAPAPAQRPADEVEDRPARAGRDVILPGSGRIRAWAGSRPSGPYICRRGRRS